MTQSEILIVDDREVNLYTLELLLRPLGATVVKATNGAEALTAALERDFCVAIIDVQMPMMDGYELVDLLRSDTRLATLPVVFASAVFSDEYHHRRGYDAGAVDFIVKPFVPEILLSKVRVFIDLHQQRKALEEEIQLRRTAEASLQKANADLSRSNTDKDTLLSIISHDLRSPFNIVLGNSKFMATRFDQLSEQDHREMVQSIYRQAQVAYNLLDNLLTWARLQRESGIQSCPEEIKLSDLINETLAVLEPTAAQKEITLSAEPVDCQVFADRRMLETVIRNLVGNALKFTARGGRVTLTAAWNGLGALAWVVVRDTGLGMSPDQLAGLFKMGRHQSRMGTEQEPGSGLGLIICKDMVERNGGTMRIDSKPNEGTRVQFSIPLVSQAALAEAEAGHDHA